MDLYWTAVQESMNLLLLLGDMKVYYNTNSKEFYTDKTYSDERVYIASKENSAKFITCISFTRSWFGQTSVLDFHLPCKLLELFCDYWELVGELIIYDIDESRLLLSEFTIKYDAKSHSFIPISGGFSFVSERVQIKFDEVTYWIKSDDDVNFIRLGVRELKDVSDIGETRQVLEKLFQLSDTIIVDEKTGTINFTFNNGKESELLFVGY